MSDSDKPYKYQVNQAWLRGLGVDDANTESSLEELARLAYDELELRVGFILANEMTNEQLDEFEALIDAKDDDAASDWLVQEMPHYTKVVGEEHEKLGDEIKNAEDKEAVIKSWAEKRNKS